LENADGTGEFIKAGDCLQHLCKQSLKSEFVTGEFIKAGGGLKHLCRRSFENAVGTGDLYKHEAN